MSKKGSVTIESAIVIPMVMLFIVALLSINIKLFVFCMMNDYTISHIDYVNFHREISSIFDSGGDIFGMLFG